MYKLQVADHSCSYYPSGCDSQEINGSAPTKNEEFEITIDKSNPNRILIGSTKSKSTCTDAWSFEKCTFIKG
jgi:hypothetical protein